IVDVLRIDGCDKRLVEPGEQFVDDFIPAVFQHVDFGGRARQARVGAPDAFQQEARSFRDDLHLFQKEVVKLLFAWQQSHNLGLIRRELMVNGLLAAGQSRDDYNSVTIGNNSWVCASDSVLSPSRFRKRVSNRRLVSTFPMAESMVSLRCGCWRSSSSNRSRRARRTVPVRCEQPHGTTGTPRASA